MVHANPFRSSSAAVESPPTDERKNGEAVVKKHQAAGKGCLSNATTILAADIVILWDSSCGEGRGRNPLFRVVKVGESWSDSISARTYSRELSSSATGDFR